LQFLIHTIPPADPRTARGLIGEHQVRALARQINAGIARDSAPLPPGCGRCRFRAWRGEGQDLAWGFGVQQDGLLADDQGADEVFGDLDQEVFEGVGGVFVV